MKKILFVYLCLLSTLVFAEDKDLPSITALHSVLSTFQDTMATLGEHYAKQQPCDKTMVEKMKPEILQRLAPALNGYEVTSKCELIFKLQGKDETQDLNNKTLKAEPFILAPKDRVYSHDNLPKWRCSSPDGINKKILSRLGC